MKSIFQFSRAAIYLTGKTICQRTKNFKNQTPFVRDQPKIKPNEPCYCGSGKKYKKCHGAGL